MGIGSHPVLVGVGQVVDHWTSSSPVDQAPSPLSLATKASRLALKDTGLTGLEAQIDTLAFVRTFEDSIPNFPHQFGHNTNLPGTLARDLGASPERLIYSGTGGQLPQALVQEMSNRIIDGEIEIALITGSESNLAAKHAKRAGIELDWADESDLPTEDRTLGERMLTRTEIKHGLIAPARFYALMENAIAAELSHTASEHLQYMSNLFAPFSEVAAKNPYSQYGTVRSAKDLERPDEDHYPITSPFLRWHIAQDAVNQGAALLLMSEEKADALSVPPAKRVYLHGSGAALDTMLSERKSLTKSAAMQIALTTALNQANMDTSDIDIFDLYSCFPCAVHCSSEVLGLDPLQDPRPLTVTGGLPYFGGAGNNYSMHAIASMVERLRATPDSTGLVLANGGWMTKEAVGIYSTRRPVAPVRTAEKTIIPDRVEIDPSPEAGILEAFTVVHGKRGSRVELGIASCRTNSGRRFLAVPDADMLTIFQAEASPIGRPVSATQQNEVNTISFT